MHAHTSLKSPSFGKNGNEHTIHVLKSMKNNFAGTIKETLYLIKLTDLLSVSNVILNLCTLKLLDRIKNRLTSFLYV